MTVVCRARKGKIFWKPKRLEGPSTSILRKNGYSHDATLLIGIYRRECRTTTTTTTSTEEQEEAEERGEWEDEVDEEGEVVEEEGEEEKEQEEEDNNERGRYASRNYCCHHIM